MPKKRPDPAEQPGDVPATELQKRFGGNLRLFRKRAGLTQAQFSQLVGIAQTEISKIELGQVNLTLGRMQRLAQVVDDDVSNLLNATPAEPQKK